MMDELTINEKDMQELLLAIRHRKFNENQLTIIVAGLLMMVAEGFVEDAKEVLELYKF